ncbi:Proteasome, subunit alpha/beta [Parasponia andersonii]|uniref:Proteasome, subunit alpha/beta n=1 Tax=Parasponia andersonii TaxID=3476 RepID=A0A2P5CT27_PARAD|nr:Proteasome, subunit alpha/beta [Parasponia andersonii]
MQSRPFGVSLLIAGHDENGPSLHYHSLSGVNIAFYSLFAMSSRSKIYCNYDFILPPLGKPSIGINSGNSCFSSPVFGCVVIPNNV